MSKSRQACVKCGRPSVPGLVKGQGVCSYHWVEGNWGKEWALTIAHAEAIAEHEQRGFKT